MTLSLLAFQHYEFTMQSLGYLYTMFGAVIVVVQAGLVGFLKKKIGEKRMALLGSFFESIFMSIATFSPTWPYLLASIAGTGFFHGIFQPTIPTMVSINSHPDYQGTILGIYFSCGSMARIFTPIVMGSLYDWYFRLPSFVAGGCVGFCFVILWFLPPIDQTKKGFLPLSQELEAIPEENQMIVGEEMTIDEEDQ